MIELARIGEFVYYTGIMKNKYKYSENTLIRLHEFFRIGNEYRVRNIIKIDGFLYYNLYEFCFPYPCECFTSNELEVIIMKYGLK